MQYTIAAIPTRYNGVQFRSRLEARWAAFFDLCNWKWEYEPIDLQGWIPDFYIEIPCYHCVSHELYAEIKPAKNKAELERWIPSIVRALIDEDYSEPHITMLGLNPTIAEWQMGSCGGGSFGTIDSLEYFLANKSWELLWKEAGNVVQWHAK